MGRLTFSTRKRWRNDARNQGIDPLREYEPTTLHELREIVKEAEASGTTVRAIGSGHAWSDVALASGFLVRPTGLADPLDLERDLLLPRAESEPPLVRVEGGMRIADLNDHLDRQGLALPNMGGYDGQTIAGVISTSTHGSGIRFGPLSDLVQSLDLVAAGGAAYRIERAGGPTDPAAYAAEHPDRVLVKDDSWFRAAVVGMGCMGVIHSVILAVRSSHHLREIRKPATWREVREELEQGVLERNDHYEVLFSPYPHDDGEIECVVTTRNEIGPDEYRRDWRRSRSWLVELTSRLWLTPRLINLVVGIWPRISPFLLHRALKAIENPDYVNVSYKVLNIGAANYLPSYSSEIGVPIDERGLHLKAVDEVVRVADRRRRLGEVYESSPISLRFVKASDAFMSMMEGRATMMIELIMLTHSEGGMELLAAYEDALYGLEGRPHWGQVNWITRDRVADLYEHFDDWLAVHRQLNASGVFDSPFSRRVGISSGG
jgi:hypothetical protein